MVGSHDETVAAIVAIPTKNAYIYILVGELVGEGDGGDMRRGNFFCRYKVNLKVKVKRTYAKKASPREVYDRLVKVKPLSKKCLDHLSAIFHMRHSHTLLTQKTLFTPKMAEAKYHAFSKSVQGCLFMVLDNHAWLSPIA